LCVTVTGMASIFLDYYERKIRREKGSGLPHPDPFV
jgi:hypothetical protein